MTDTMTPYVITILVSVFVASVSQVMLKKASQREYSSFLQEYLNPLVMTAYILFFGTTVLTIFAYRGIPLSLGQVLETTAYLYITLFGAVIFKEKITTKKIIALIMIIGGVILFAIG